MKRKYTKQEKELTMDISMLNLEQTKKYKIELMIKKVKDCLQQLKEFEEELDSMEAPKSFECELQKFRGYWKVSREIDKLYKWMKKVELSNYPITSQEELQEYIDFWEDKLHD